MLKAGFPSDCWVDVFDADYFEGKRRRLLGPQRIPDLKAKSLIVGPKAAIVLSIFRGKTKSVIRLDSKRVVPDLAKSLGGAVFREVVVESVE